MTMFTHFISRYILNKKTWTGVASIWVLSFITSPSSANTLAAVNCAHLFDRKTPKKWGDELTSEMKALRQRHFNDVLLSDSPPRYYEGDPVRIHKKYFTDQTTRQFEIIRWLGNGVEAEVYLVKNSAGDLFALKKFFTPSEAKLNVEALDNFRQIFPDNTVRVLAVDYNRGILLLDYIKGETLHDLRTAHALPSLRKIQWMDKYLEWNHKAKSHGVYGLIEANIIIRESDHKPMIVDPY